MRIGGGATVMLPRVLQFISNKLSSSRTHKWPIRIRLVISVLAVQFIILSALVGITILLHQQNGIRLWPPSDDQSRPLILLQFILIVLAFGALASIVSLLAGTLTSRINSLTALVEGQVASSSLNIMLDATNQTDEVGRLIMALNKLSLAYQNTLEDLGRRADEMAMLNLVAATINRTLDLQQVFDTSLRAAVKCVNWDTGAIYMWDERIESLNMVSYVGLSEEAVRNLISYKPGEGIVGQAAKRRETIVVEDVRENAEYAMQYQPEMPITQVSIPLVTVPGQLLGVLLVGNSTQTILSKEALNLLVTVAHQMALAIDKAQLYAKVSKHAEELESIVEARTEQLAQAIQELSVALERAQEADKVKSLLLSTVSHELRTPLATIKGNTSMLLENHAEITPDMLVQHLQDIEEETDKLTELISNLLEMSRIEAGILQINPAPIDLIDVLTNAVSTAQVRLLDHPLHLSVPQKLPYCLGDPRRIEQVVANLLDNAAKFSAAGTPIEIRAEQQGQELVVSVSDQGVGIAPEHLDQIFDRFYQIKTAHSSGRHGIGLGLAICRGLVEAQGGRIWAESVVGQGSTFYFSLPTTLARETFDLKGNEHEADKYSRHR